MLKLYGAHWCPHCVKAMAYLNKNNIKFDFVNMDTIDVDTEKKVIEANGGDDWIIPTLEFNGKWISGKKFDVNIFAADLKSLGV
ncbi:glutaredoxin family protein [Lentisphaerota bacterium WC36G]|nr:glutaredoxin family protein [Lentisphaerae bacterium WC36]